MIDLLLKFPSVDVAVQVGQALGVTAPSEEGDGTFATIQADHNVAVCVIGEHFVPTGVTLTDDEGNEHPEMIGDGQWWVMIRGRDGTPVPPDLDPYIVTPNPADPTIPDRRWA